MTAAAFRPGGYLSVRYWQVRDYFFTRRPVPANLTAAIEPMFHAGRDGDGVGLTGYPVFIGAETDGNGVRYARFRLGFGPEAHVIIRTPDARFGAEMAEAGMQVYDALNPVPAAMEGQS